MLDEVRVSTGWTPVREALPIAGRMLLAYLLLTFVLVWLAARGTAGFSYSLDDPYIHMALAQNLRHGTYGINAGETSSPASSVLWPFLLVPFAESAVRAWVPLLFNLACGAMACFVLGRFLQRWCLEMRPAMGSPARWSIAVLCVFAANLAGLTLMGMEHTLQIVLVAGCAYALGEMFAGRPAPAWSLVAAALAPALRYEDLAFTLAVALACWLQGRRQTGTAVMAASFMPLLALGAFLHRHGLGWLPNSVVVKGGVYSARPHLLPSHPLMDHFLTVVAVNWLGYLTAPDRWPITIFIALLVWQVRARWDRASQRNALLAGLAGLLLIVSVGPYGYQHRYDAAYRLFGFLLVLIACSGLRWFRPAVLQMTFLLAAGVYALATVQVPADCFRIAHEQKQMQRFTHEFYRRDVAINDLGWVSFDSHDRFYVLDLAGLASNEASHQRAKDAAWLDGITREHRVGLAMIYRSWFLGIPETWTQVAILKRTGGGPDQVWIYATAAGDADEIRGDLQRFKSTLSQGSTLVFSPGTTKSPGE